MMMMMMMMMVMMMMMMMMMMMIMIMTMAGTTTETKTTTVCHDESHEDCNESSAKMKRVMHGGKQAPPAAEPETLAELGHPFRARPRILCRPHDLQSLAVAEPRIRQKRQYQYLGPPNQEHDMSLDFVPSRNKKEKTGSAKD